MSTYEGPWLGGFISKDGDGNRIYVIRKSINGVKYKVSTRCHTERAALKQLEQFEADPESYWPGRDPNAEGLFLNDDLSKEFLKWSKTTKKNSAGWVRQQQRHLAWWADQLDGLDLRAGKGPKRVSLKAHLLPMLDEISNREQRIRVLKALYSWLRKESHKIEPEQDPTLDALSAKQVEPEQWKRPKAVAKADYDKVRVLLDDIWKARLDVLGATGWHSTEIRRFAANGSIETLNEEKEGVAGVLLVPLTKAGTPLRTQVSARGLEAAKKVRAAGAFSYERFHEVLAEACLTADVTKFGPGQLRHSVATWAFEAGTDLGAISSFLNHKSTMTTRRFYATLATPKKIPTLV